MNNDRNIGVIRGASFYRDNGETMFQFGVDPNNVLGPRIATDSDKAQFPGEWAAFQLAYPSGPQVLHLSPEEAARIAPPAAHGLRSRETTITDGIASLLPEDMVKSGPRAGKPKVDALETVTCLSDLTAKEIDSYL